MFGMLAGLGGSLLKQLVPSAINWGLRKLSSTNLGKKYVPAQMLTGIGNLLSQAAINKGDQLMATHSYPPSTPSPQPVGMYMTLDRSR